MPRTLNQEFEVVNFLPVGVYEETAEGDAVKMVKSDMFAYDTGLVIIDVGELGEQKSTKITIEESDDEAFAEKTIIEGGKEITVEANTTYVKEIERTKEYVRAVLTIDEDNNDNSAVISVNGILWNAARPFQGTLVVEETPES